ncbi:hypothetical protein RI129_002834 [Pyrocoelia pectoralis]|uniref:DUF7869 domain-containing protein n=1 Tax=Pyrocoelia pectoralis TaxID=417401 RepID=A0AAN7ZLZ6_9COLE
MREKHGKQPTVDPKIKESVRKFIRAIPRIESHYLRAQTKREYIESGKSLADLHRDYKEERERQRLPAAHIVMFNRIFNEEFNISFYIPKKDQCDLCESYKNADEEEKKKLVVAYNNHLNQKELSRQEKDTDKKNQNGTYVAVYDLQAVMPVPKGLVSSFYYTSKLNYCFFWNETEGKRGAIEIGSCVLSYISMLVEKVNKPNEIDIIFYSDNCCGQQKNKYLLTTYAYALQKFNVRRIEHKFLICGHSQNEGDNIHSVIEKQISRHLKSGPIYIPEQYSTLIRTAKKNGTPYRVHDLTNEDFFDLKLLQEEWGNNFNVAVDRKKVNWHDIKILKVEKEHPHSFFFKTSYSDTEFKKVIVKKSKKSQEDFSSVQLVPAYSKKLPLTDAKNKALQSLCEKNIIKKPYYELFYKNIFDLR